MYIDGKKSDLEKWLSTGKIKWVNSEFEIVDIEAHITLRPEPGNTMIQGEYNRIFCVISSPGRGLVTAVFPNCTEKYYDRLFEKYYYH
jgi:hypothetical protein